MTLQRRPFSFVRSPVPFAVLLAAPAEAPDPHRARGQCHAALGIAAGRGVHFQHAAPSRARADGAGPLDVGPSRPGVCRTAAACAAQQRHGPPGAGQHGPAIVRPRRVECGKARPIAPEITQAPLGHGCDRPQTPCPEPACAKGRDRHRSRGAEQDDPDGKARLRPRRLDGAREGPAQLSADPCNNAATNRSCGCWATGSMACPP